MAVINLSFPDSSYSSSVKPSIATLKSDLTLIETNLNSIVDAQIASNADIAISKLVTSGILGAGVRLGGITAFSAYQSADAALDNNDTVIFDTQTFDVGGGNNYSTATGVFTTPVAGYYLFIAKARYGSVTTPVVDQKRYGLGLIHDGSAEVNNVIAASGAGAIDITISKLIYCAASKNVHITGLEDATGQVAILGGSYYTYFTGFLIAQL